jgi:hypothetical protein
MHWFKHAFAVEGPEDFRPTDSQQELVDRICRQIVARELTTPAMLFLESVQPLNYLTSQSMQFFRPLISLVGPAATYEEVAALLERRGSVEFLIRRLEHHAAAQSSGGTTGTAGT